MSFGCSFCVRFRSSISAFLCTYIYIICTFELRKGCILHICNTAFELTVVLHHYQSLCVMSLLWILCERAHCRAQSIYSHNNRVTSRTRTSLRVNYVLIIVWNHLWVYIYKKSQSSHCHISHYSLTFYLDVSLYCVFNLSIFPLCLSLYLMLGLPACMSMCSHLFSLRVHLHLRGFDSLF